MIPTVTNNHFQGWTQIPTVTNNHFQGWTRQNHSHADHPNADDVTPQKRQQRRYRRLHLPTTHAPKQEQLQNLQRHQPATREQQKHDRLSSNKIENDVNKALAVMDKSSGKMLNYRQLMRHPEYRKQWSLSSANEFGRLANGVGNRIKGTNTIKFLHKSQIPKD